MEKEKRLTSFQVLLISLLMLAGMFFVVASVLTTIFMAGLVAVLNPELQDIMFRFVVVYCLSLIIGLGSTLILMLKSFKKSKRRKHGS